MNETAIGVYVGAVTNLLVVALLNNPPWGGDPAMSTWLITLGTWNEVLGVLLVASPELLPRAQRAFRYLLEWLSVRARRVSGVLRRALRLPGRNHYVNLASAVSAASAVGARLSLGAPSGSVEDRLKWLIEKVRKHDERIDDIDQEVTKLPDRWQADMDVMRQELEGLSRELVRSVADARIRLRLIGLTYIVLGLVLAWVGNVV